MPVFSYFLGSLAILIPGEGHGSGVSRDKMGSNTNGISKCIGKNFRGKSTGSEPNPLIG